jgi:hypothetical protein
LFELGPRERDIELHARWLVPEQQHEALAGELLGVRDPRHDPFFASALISVPASIVSPRTAASMSAVNRRTPRAITAMPPMIIHGTPVAPSADTRSRSAC